METSMQDLVQRFLSNTATAGERERVMRLLAEGRLGKVLGEQVYQHMVFYINNPGQLGIRDEDRQRSQTIKWRSFDFILENHGIPTRPDPPSPWFAAIPVLIIMLLAGVWLMQQSRAEVPPPVKHPTVASEAVYQGRQYLRLPDNTAVTLNDESELRYHLGTDGSIREVTLTGEAYFDVAHDPQHPFIIHANGITVKVLGTAFNVKAYAGNPDVRVTVARGLVDVSKAGNFQSLLYPDQEMTVDAETGHFSRRSVTAAEAIGWNQHFLIFENTDIAAVADILARRFGRQITVEGSDIGACRISASFLDEQHLSLTGVLDAITHSAGSTRYKVLPSGDVVLHVRNCR